MSERYPDLEIYIYKASSEALQEWLTTALGCSLEQVSPSLWRTQQPQPMSILFTPQAEKNFSSLWFKHNQTPWDNDYACAEAAHLALNTEVRCQAQSWQETEDEATSDHPNWIKFIRGQAAPCYW